MRAWFACYPAKAFESEPSLALIWVSSVEIGNRPLGMARKVYLTQAPLAVLIQAHRPDKCSLISWFPSDLQDSMCLRDRFDLCP